MGRPWFHNKSFKRGLGKKRAQPLNSDVIPINKSNMWPFNKIQERKIRNAFKGYLGDELTEKILKNPAKLKLGADIRELTVSVTNMTGYVGIAEEMPLADLHNFMNKYFEFNCDEILKAEGCIDKLEGDKIISFWNLFEAGTHSAQLACESAIAQINSMNQFYDWAKSKGYPCPKIRIGINTGEMVIGNLGTKTRMDFTVMGDATNIAFRIEEAAKVNDIKILVGHSTRENTTGFDFGEAVTIEYSNSTIEGYPLIN